MNNKTVHIPAIHCEYCVRTIESEIGDLEGVPGVTASGDKIGPYQMEWLITLGNDSWVAKGD